MDGAIGRKDQVRGRCSWRSTDSKLFSQCSASLLSRVLGAKWGYESHRWDGLSDPGIRLCRLPTLVPFSSTNLHPGDWSTATLGQKIWAGTRLGSTQAQSLNSREMASPRAGCKPEDDGFGQQKHCCSSTTGLV